MRRNLKQIFWIIALVAPFAIFSQNIIDAKWEEVNGINIPIPPKEHPRLYLRAHNIPDLKKRMSDPDLQDILATLQVMEKDRDPKDIPQEKGWRFYVEQKGLTVRAEMDALDYLLTKDKKVGRRAITSILDTLTTANWPNVHDIARASGRMMVTGAIVYDWCYNLLKDEEKQIFIKSFIRLAETLECGYPPVKQNPITGHSSEWMIHRDLLSAAIAIYDEYPEMYELTAVRLFKDHIPVRNWLYNGHAYHQGSSYDNVRFACDLFPLWIFDRMGAGNVYSPDQQYVIYNSIYKRRGDGKLMPSGDTNPSQIKVTYFGLPAMLASSYYKDEYINHEFRKKVNTIDSRSILFDLLWRDTKLDTKSPTDLPLSKYFESPFGWMIARTGWNANSVVAEMKINEYNFSNHQHLDAGTFQIYYKGPLAIDSGAYTGSSGGYNSEHNKNYFKRTIAHNSLLVFDPDETFECINYGGYGKTPTATNDGGQKFPGISWGPPSNFDDLLKNFKTGKVIAHKIGEDAKHPEYSYLKGSITDSYSAKVNNVKRSFVFLNLKNAEVPAIMIVYDKVVSSNTNFKKTWLLHSIEKPSVFKNETTISRTKNGDSGKLINTTLLPKLDNSSIQIVGGKGKEFWVNGKNYENNPTSRPDPANERGAWRVELSPLKKQKENYFLNVIQVMDNNVEKKLDIVHQELKQVHLVQIKDNIVTFSKTGEAISNEISIKLKGKEAQSILLTDLLAGNWQIVKNGKKIKDILVKEEEGTIYFEGKSGNYKFIKR